MCVLGRLVPHKQVEHAIDAVVALSKTHPGLQLDVVGTGWWDAELLAYAERQGVADRVIFHGYVSDETKHGLLAAAWVMALPSLKEGWGLVVGEAGSHATPTVAYASAGGTNESIDHLRSGYLAHSEQEFITALGHILDDQEWRGVLGRGALDKSQTFTWPAAQDTFARLVATEAISPTA